MGGTALLNGVVAAVDLLTCTFATRTVQEHSDPLLDRGFASPQENVVKPDMIHQLDWPLRENVYLVVLVEHQWRERARAK